MRNLRCVLQNAKLVALGATANLTPPTRAQHVTQIAASGLHIKLSAFRNPLESLVSRWWAETRHYTWGWCNCLRPLVDQWCCWTCCGPTASIVSIWPSCYRHLCSRQHRDTFLILFGHHGQHQRPWTWSSSCWHGALYFPFQPSIPWAWRYNPRGCLQWARGHQHREATMAHQCGTYVITLPAPRWRAVG